MNNLLRSIDNWIFKKIEQLKLHPNYQKVLEGLNQIPDDYQALVNNILTLVITSLPVGLIVLMFMSINNLERDLAIKSEILALTEKIINRNEEVRKTSKILVSPKALEKQSDMNNVIQGLARRVNIAGKIAVKDFDSLQPSPIIIEARAKITFQNFTLKNFTGFMNQIERRERMRIRSTQIKRNPGQNLLEGHIEISHYGKITFEEDGN